ncbi:putative serine protease K12H4.7 [Cydia amplana]|uniref:putative serine protease K12H4.7 n=1 Tax=Cydia amplana TaxID=1869771 RepID=UPI002FE610C5
MGLQGLPGLLVFLASASALRDLEPPSPSRVSRNDPVEGLSSLMLLLALASALRDLEPPAPSRVSRNDPVEGWLTVRLNHFKASFNDTFRMRYYYNDEFAENNNIVIFVGGEWAIHPGWTQGGLAYELAELTKAALFYTEHRYYGNTRPSPDTSVEDLRYLTVDQALGDLAQFIQHVKSDAFQSGRYRNGSVGLVGCSYAGSMATWMKLGYPHLIDAAFSDSGPLHAQEDFPEYLEVITEAIRSQGSEACLTTIEQAVERIVEQLATTTGPDNISSLFNTCSTIQATPLDMATFFWFGITETFAYLVQYATPGDIPDACAVLTDASVDDPVQRLANWITSQPWTQPCIETRYTVIVDQHTNTSYDAPQAVMRLWTYQTCVEYGWYQTTTSNNQPFLNTIPLEYFHQMCRDFFSSYFDEQLLASGVWRTNALFAGRHLPDGVVTVAGGLDPWAPMGPNVTHATEMAPVYVVPTVSHCRAVQSTASSETEELARAKRAVLSHMQYYMTGERSSAHTTFASTVSLLVVIAGFLLK